MNPIIVGFIRGAVYAGVVAIVHYIATNLGASGIVSGVTALILTGVFASIDHTLPTP